MRLFFSPGACSLSPHIVLQETGLPFEAELVSLNTKKTKSGKDFTAINPKGQVPTLELDDGQILTEGAAIVQYIADRKDGGGTLLPPAGSMERVRVQEWLNYVASELHKGFSPLFGKTTPEEYKTTVKESLAKKFAYLDKQLEGKKYLTGDNFTVADAYLFTILRWSFPMKIDLPKNVAEYVARVSERPAVKAVLDSEKLSADKPAH